MRTTIAAVLTAAFALALAAPAPAAVLFDSQYGTAGFGNYSSSYRADRGYIVDDPVLGSARKVALLVADETTTDGSNVRVQFGNSASLIPNDNNSPDRYLRASYLFPADYPARKAASGGGFWWNNHGDVHGPPFSGSPEIVFTTAGDTTTGRTKLAFTRNGGFFWSGPFVDDVRGRWVDIIMRLRSRTNSTGLVQVWMNTGSGWVLQTLGNGSTIWQNVPTARSGSGPSSYFKIATYYPRGTYGTSRTVRTYFADHMVTTTLEEAMARTSYGTTPPPDPDPATPAPVMGATTAGTAWGGMGVDRHRASKFSLTAASTVSQVKAHLRGINAGATQATRAVIYADNAGEPGALVAQSGVINVSGSAAAGWVTFPLTTAATLQSGQYWIGLHSGATNNTVQYSHTTVTGALRTAPDVFSDGANATWTPGDAPGDLQIAIHAVGVPG